MKISDIEYSGSLTIAELVKELEKRTEFQEYSKEVNKPVADYELMSVEEIINSSW